MTSTKVLGSMNSQAVNLMNLTQPTSKASGVEFKDFMKQAGSDSSKIENKSASDLKNLKNTKTDSKPMDDKPVEAKEVKESDGKDIKVSPAKDERPVTDEEVDTVKEAVASVFESIKEELEVTDEEILQALENLGLTQVALLDTGILPEVIAEIEGAEDKLAIVTDENLFNKLMTVEDITSRAATRLISEDKLIPEEFTEALETIKRKQPAEKPVMPVNPIAETESTNEPVSLEDKISIRIDRSVAQNAGRKENVANLGEATAEETEFKPITSDLRRSDFFDRSKDQSPKDNPMNFAQNLLAKAVEAMNEASETVSYTTFDARNILDQITEAIKVDLSPETSEINL